ncbi:MAG: hypothetical protein ACLFV3_02520 [Phycisphaeraceae bacterium]
MFERTMSRFACGVALLAAVAVAGVTLVGQDGAQAQMPAPQQGSAGQQETASGPPADEARVVVGTYQPQAVFQAHPAQEELLESLRSTQEEMQKAQDQGDMETVRQIQQEYDNERQKIVEEFQTDVEQTLPELAEDADIDIVALEVTYRADDVRTEDITSDLVSALSDEEEQPEAEQPEAGEMPRQLPGQSQ